MPWKNRSLGPLHGSALCKCLPIRPSNTAHRVALQPPFTNYIAPKRDEPADRKAGGQTQRCVMADHAAQPVLPSCPAVERTTRRGLTRDFVMNVHLRGCRVQDQTAFQDRQPCQIDCDVGVPSSRQRKEKVFVPRSSYRRLKYRGVSAIARLSHVFVPSRSSRPWPLVSTSLRAEVHTAL